MGSQTMPWLLNVQLAKYACYGMEALLHHLKAVTILKA